MHLFAGNISNIDNCNNSSIEPVPGEVMIQLQQWRTVFIELLLVHLPKIARFFDNTPQSCAAI